MAVPGRHLLFSLYTASCINFSTRSRGRAFVSRISYAIFISVEHYITAGCIDFSTFSGGWTFISRIDYAVFV